MTYKKYNLEFLRRNEHCSCQSTSESTTLANFLSYWNDPTSIIENLIPAIDFGMKYGTKDRYSTYGEIQGLEDKMKSRWIKSNLDGIREKIDIDESWSRVKNYNGYYISELDFWLEGIDADIFGNAFVTAKNTTIEFSDSNLSNIDLPSKDLKEIVLEWLAYLLKYKEISSS